ncbi:putative RNA polymerase Rpc34 subunit [Lyophyllum shimeji]|uniref:RNA polymerase Rpc34 subunit n=1 Tax=Lyophyllum shimeji TaxID=47721 RepID=A0A9P3PDP6_LYOSH|nr:putative RNA polymerase Rpc34 subunit [Lyophyllum shimeji]
MYLPQLPAELLDAICQRVETPDLVALARTDSTIHPIAQRLLYRHLSLTSTSHNLQAVVALSKKPELARHVRTFSLRLGPSTVFSSFYHLLGVALSGMTELISLDLFVDSTASWILSEIQCTYPRLAHFASSFPFDGHVAAFLRTTDALLELELDGGSTDPLTMPTLPVASIPRLSEFVGASHVATAIVPGRPVESIQLPSGDLREEDVIALANSTAHVVIFSAASSSVPMPLLESLSQRLPHLVYLRLMTTCNFSEPPEPSFYEQIATVLTSLPDLKAFELSGMHWGPSQKAAEDAGRTWQSHPLELTPKQAEAIVPDVAKRQNALNFLLGVGLLKSLVDAKGAVTFRGVTKGEITATKDLTGEESLVLGHIKASKTEGIWTKHLKAKTNLHQTIIDRALKTLTQKRLIKRVPSVQHPTRKIYMLEGLEPSVALTGGPWYTDNEFDTEFIQHLSDACLKFIRDITFPKRPEGALYALSNQPEYPTAQQIRNSLRKARLTETELSVEHVEMLLNVLILDGEIERLPSFGPSMWKTSIGGGEEEEEERYRKKRKRADEDESRRKRKRSYSDEEDSSDSEDASRKKSRRKRAKGLSDSESDSEDKRSKRSKKKKRISSDSEDTFGSEDEGPSSRKKRSKKRRSGDSSDSENASDDYDGKRAMKRSPSPFRDWDELDTSGGGGFVYRAIRQERPKFGASEAPCSQCPSFDFCKDGGPVNPQECVYYGEWLVGGTLAAMETI